MLYVQAVGEKGVKVASTDSPKSRAFPFTALCELRKKGVRGIFKREDGKLFAVPMTPVKAGGVKYFGKKIAPSEYAGLVWKDTLSSVSQSRFKQYKGVYARGAERPNTFCVDSVGVDGSWMPQVTNLAFGTIPCILVSENTGTKAHMLYPERVPSINSYLDAWVENNKVQLVNAHCEYDSELNMFKVPKELHDTFYITLPKSPLQLDGDERASKRLSYYSGNVIMEYTVEDLRRVGLDAKYILCSLDIDKRGNQGVLSCWVTDRGSTELVTLPDIVYDLRAMASQGETNARVRKYYPDIEIRGNTLVMTCMQGTFTFDIDALLQDNTNAMDMGSAGVSGLGKVLTTPVVAGVGTTSIPAGIGMPSVSLLSPDEVTVDGTVAVGAVVPVSLSRDGDTITASDGITYEINEKTGEAYVKTADKSIIVANILSEVEGYPVTTIGDHAFKDCTSLTSVTIPNSVTYIGEDAFKNCKSLTSVTIPVSVTSIGDWVFGGCTSLTSVTVGDSVKSTGAGVFSNCTSLASIVIPDSVTSIGDWVFGGCTSLTAVTIPDSVTSIGRMVFYGCRSLTSVTIPSSVTSIGENAFWCCTSLTSVTIPDSVTSIDDTTFSGCTSLTAVTIPDSVTSIGDMTFYNCTSLTTVTIPDSVTSIGENAIGYVADSGGALCARVPDFTIYGYIGSEAETYANENEIKFIALDGDEIVYGIDEEKGVAYVKSASKSLTVANIESEYKGYRVASVGFSAFDFCTALTSVTIPDSVTYICRCAFTHCTSLTSVTIPDSVTSIDEGAFYNCTSLTAVTIPSSVTNIGSSAFGAYFDNNDHRRKKMNNFTIYGYRGTEAEAYANKDGFKFVALDGDEITYETDEEKGVAYVICAPESLTVANIKSEYKGYSVTYIGEYAFENCTSLTSVTIPDSVISIDYCAFYNCTSLTEITIGGSVTSIDKGTFYNCTSLTEITIPDSVTSIGEQAFRDCTSLTSVTIPDSVTYIDASAFHGCTLLTSVTIPSSVTHIDIESFGYWIDEELDTQKVDNFTIYGYRGTEAETYANKNGFKFVALDGDEIVYGVDEGKGVAYVMSAPESLTVANIKSEYKGYRVTSIIDEAFYNCTFLTSVTIPNSVTYIGDGVFSHCDSLASAIIPDSVTSIGNRAFEDCTSLTAITIPDSVTYIGEYAFEGCKSLTSITIPDSVTSIGYGAFSSCRSLTSVTVPDSVTSIDDYAFDNCTSLTAVTIPNSVTSIGLYAFYGCTSLTAVTIPSSVIDIDDMAFRDCTSLTSVTIPDSVTSIGEDAFGYYFNENGKFRRVENFTIYGYTGSEAETYANENEIKFVALDDRS